MFNVTCLKIFVATCFSLILTKVNDILFHFWHEINMTNHAYIRINIMQTIETEKIWDEVKAELVKELPETSYPWIFSLEPTGYSGGVFTVVTALSMAMTIIRKNHLQQIKDALKKVTGNVVDFEIIVDKDALNASISHVYKLCDKAVSKGVLHKNTAARKKSRLVLAIKKLAK